MNDKLEGMCFSDGNWLFTVVATFNYLQYNTYKCYYAVIYLGGDHKIVK